MFCQKTTAPQKIQNTISLQEKKRIVKAKTHREKKRNGYKENVFDVSEKLDKKKSGVLLEFFILVRLMQWVVFLPVDNDFYRFDEQKIHISAC